LDDVARTLGVLAGPEAAATLGPAGVEDVRSRLQLIDDQLQDDLNADEAVLRTARRRLVELPRDESEEPTSVPAELEAARRWLRPRTWRPARDEPPDS
jgi:hypothetical protein